MAYLTLRTSVSIPACTKYFKFLEVLKNNKNLLFKEQYNCVIGVYYQKVKFTW